MCKKLFCKVALVLVMVSMIANLFPIDLLAKEMVDIYSTDKADETVDIYSTNKEEPNQNINSEQLPREIKGEITSQRTRNTKEFMNSDWTTTAAVYPYAVHYMKDGKWQDIDNSLVESDDTDGQKIKENKANDFKVKFANKVNDKKLINIKDDKVDISWSLVGANKVSLKERTNKEDLSKLDKNEAKMAAKNIASSVIYSDILKNVDIIYAIEGESVKEDIVLKNVEAVDNKFVFNLDVGNLEAKLNDDKTISIYNSKNEVVSTIDSPFMYDSKLESSDDIEVSLIKNKKDYTMEIKPSVEWLKSPERVYPVTIDPTVQTPVYYQDIQDTYIYAGDSDNATRYRAHIVRAGGGISKIFRGLLKFTLPTLNSGDQVIDAQLRMNNYPETTEWTPWTGPLQINVHKVTSDWQQENAYWSNSANIYDPRIVDYSVYQYSSSDPQKQNFWNITSIVKDWYTTGNNYGLMLKENTEAVTGHNEAYYLSADTDVSYYLNSRPVVSITYRNQSGLENYWSFHEQSVGRAGTGYVNDYNGNLVFMHPDFSTPGDRMPASVYHVYNSNDKTDNIGYGKGWRLNVSQMIQLVTIDSVNYARYIDEDGTRHYFVKQGTTNTYLDEDGLGLTLTLNGDTTFTMTDKGGNKLIFEKRIVNSTELWHLREIIDSGNRKTTISFIQAYPNNFYIDKITDTAGSEIKFNWSNFKLDSIVDQDNKVLFYRYDENVNLTNIVYPDSKQATYTYNGSSFLTSVKNVDNSHIDYEYYSNMPYRIKTIREYSTANELGNSLSLTYGENTTTFTDNKNNSNTYNFSDLGNITSVVDFGNVANGYNKAYGKAFKYGTSGGEKNKLTLESKLTTSVQNKLKNGNMEADGYWTYWYWDVNNGSISFVNTQAYVGSRSLKVVANGATAQSRMYGYQWITLEKGKTYTLSTYVKTEGITNNNGGGAAPFIYYYTPSGTKSVTGTYVTGNSEWNRYSCTFTYGTDATSDVVLALGIIGENGTAYFDGVQLEEGETANTYNLIENGNFDDGTLNFWAKNEYCGANETVINSNGNNVAKLTGEYNKNKYLLQVAKINGKSGDILNLSAWVKNAGVKNSGNKSCRITLRIFGTAGQGDWLDFPISSDSTAWQFTSNEFKTKYDYTSIEVYLVNYANANEVYFDDVSLLKDDFGQSYSYDKNGNLVSTQDMAKQDSTLQYNGKNELLKDIDPKGGSYVYEYDSQLKNRLFAAVNNSKVRYSFEYDQYGNAVTSTTSNLDKVSTNITPGKTYYIRSKSSGLYFDAYGSGTASGTKVDQYSFHGGLNQQWKAFDAGNGYYYLKPAYAPDTVALDSVSPNKVALWEFNGSDTQKWKLVKNDDGSFKMLIKYQEQTNCVTVVGDSRLNEGLLQQEKDENLENQRFYFEEVGVDNSADKSIAESGEVFYIKSKYSGLYLDYMKDANGNIVDANDKKLVQREFSGSDSQKWRIVRKDNGEYKLISQYSSTGRGITIYAGLNQNNNTAEMYDYYPDSLNQEWTITKLTDGSYMLASKSTSNSKFLTILGNVTTPEAGIVIYENTGGLNQQWYLEPTNTVNVEDGATYKIKNKNSGLYVGVKDNGDSDGAKLEQASPSENLSQQWQFVDLKNGYYKIISKSSAAGRIMDVSAAGTINGTDIQLWQYGGVSQQQWEIVPVGDNSFYLKPRHTTGTKTLDVSGASTVPGARMQLWEPNSTGAQQFYLEKVAGTPVESIRSSVTYKENGRFVDKVTDSRGKQVTYNYNFSGNTGSGTLKDVTDAKGNKINYEYDNLDRITKTSLVTADKTYENSYEYNNDKISKILHNGFAINFIYDNFGNTKQVKVGDQTLVTNNYAVNNGNLQSVTYGNNQTVSYEYDRFDRVSKKTGTNGTQEYVYDARGNVGLQKDNVNNVSYNFTYDLADRLVKVQGTNGYNEQYGYDKNSNVNNITYKLGSVSNALSYALDNDNKAMNLKWDTDKYVMYDYDRLSRLQDTYLKSGTNTYKTSMTYVSDPSNPLKTTNILESITNGTNSKISYTYDDNGNIETIKKGTEVEQKYYYDELNQLIREDNFELGKTTTYSYDVGGNITSTKVYDYTTDASLEGKVVVTEKTYGYDTTWKDKLTNFNGKEMTYDEIGNPLTYDGNTYTWQNGRQLAGINKEGTSISYKYNDSGIRTEKTVNGITTKYYLSGDKVIYETTGENTIYYIYDTANNLVGFKYNGTQYFYTRNGQGDIIGILDNNMQQVISYTYDSWGKIISIKNGSGVDVTNDPTSIGNINPYRYRGYMYDNETGMYYLQSRYYNPEWSRFINADKLDVLNVDQDSLLENNLFAYCLNNPVNMTDKDGEIAWFIAAAIGGALFDSAIYLASSAASGNFSWGGLGKAALTGAITGVALGGIGKIATKVIKATSVTTKLLKAANFGTTIGKLGKYVKNPGIKINWSYITDHAIQRMAERGVSKTLINNIIKNGKVLQQAANKFLYITREGAVVMDSSGKIITTYSSKYFDSAIKEAITKLF